MIDTADLKRRRRAPFLAVPLKILLISLIFSVAPVTSLSDGRLSHIGPTRREAVLIIAGGTTTIGSHTASAVNPKVVEPPATERRIVRLNSGVQFADFRTGTGPPAKGEIVLRVRMLNMNDKVIFDTADTEPILYTLGSAEDFENFRANSSGRSAITIGLEDAIVARGIASWEG
eukprot:CAMPEP_0194326818 /NCGR_PEP_ID=MMETSP0171-20130528/38545_1 /TAXON_ID=218684 /ORGANISM="Corethron pennatum, Strain L29A3" /LENGTH=173 /DNA_ID=CAMNT_0039086557 /DNA_START=64 /DNA_END=582 /DNA_ORIENTATION=-